MILENTSIRPGFVFDLEDGNECAIMVLRVKSNTTLVWVVVHNDITPQNIKTRIWPGIALCHPNDKFRLITGIKTAVRNALQLDNEYYFRSKDTREYRKMVYRSFRTALRDKVLDF